MFDNTFILFLSDNGGCAEFLKEDGESDSWPAFYGTKTSTGILPDVGNIPERMPGGCDTFMSYDLPWANASNTPFRLFKSWVHEGGISTPCLMHWPAGIKNAGQIHHKPWVMPDIVASCLDICGIEHPQQIDGRAVQAIEGQSFASIFEDNEAARPKPIFWEHQGNCAVRDGNWKLVRRHPESWELFNMESDRTELNNLVDEEPDRVKAMSKEWDVWAERCGVRAWPLTRPTP